VTPRQKKIFGAFLALLLLSQCVAVVASFSASADALRVWVSPRLVRGSSAHLRAVVVAASDLSHRHGVTYRVSLRQGRREQQLLEKTESGEVLDLGFLVPNWPAGEARLVVRSDFQALQQEVSIRLQLIDKPEAGVRWVEPFRALAGDSPSDAAETEPKRSARIPLTAFPLTGWAVRNIDLPLVVRRKSGSVLRLRREGDSGVGKLFGVAGFAALNMPQPLHRGRYRVQVADAKGFWATHDLWLHNPPAELQIMASQRSVKPGEEIHLTLRSDSRRSNYKVQIYHDAQWQQMIDVPMSEGQGELRLRAMAKTGWLSAVWASDLVTDGRRRAFIALRVGDAPMPQGLSDELAHTGTPLGRQAMLSRIQPLRLQPPLRADTMVLRKAQVEEERLTRQRYASLGFQLVAVAFISWLCINILAMQLSRTRSRKALVLEMEEARSLAGHPFQTLGTILLLLGLLCLLLIIGYLFSHMTWGS
jgi:hypothetical protein